jgi:ABC-type dipeptide/oligopeptide/nickel transport system permease component
MDKFPNTMILAITAMFFAVLVGLTSGIISSIRPGSLLDRGIMVLTLAGISAPVFWVGLILVLVVGVILRWLPPTGFGGFEYLILPAVTLGLRSAAYLARLTRATMLDVLSQDYIRTARSKKLPEWKVVIKHAFPNTLIPVITIIGTDFGSYLSGAVLTESIFGWPGIGRLALEAILKRDFPVIQGTVLFMALMFVLMNVLVDMLYGFVDPRVRLERSRK